ncbi:MAG: hypothetical protein KDA37_12260 [Planctomycetales bacterium]|nr:hypothetical protein [Planctomycetales bacterium]
MSASNKELCEWSKKDYVANFELLQKIVSEPKFACIKCGRAACEKKWLCKAKSLKYRDPNDE